MKPEEKSAVKAAGATALVAGAVAAVIGNPVAWAAVLYGAYRMGKTAYHATKAHDTLERQRKNHYL
jgi:hypothetical protein